MISSTYICRAGALTIEAVERLRASSLVSTLEGIRAIELQLKGTAQAVSDGIHKAVGASSIASARRNMINVRRQLFKRIQPPDGGLQLILGELPSDTRDLVNTYLGRLKDRDRLYAQMVSSFPDSMKEVRAKLSVLARDKNLLATVALTSQSLMEAILRYEPDRPKRRDEKTEQGLLKYVSRMGMKATPFGRLCVVVPGSVLSAADDGDMRLRLCGTPHELQSQVRPNAALLGVLWSMMTTTPTIFGGLTVELNPTLQMSGNGPVFLADIGGREVFQRVAPNAALDEVLRVLSATAERTYDQVVRDISDCKSIDASVEEADAYVRKLIGVGLIRFRPIARTTSSDWDVRTLRWAEASGTPAGGIVATFIRSQMELHRAMEVANGTDRQLLAGRVRSLVADVLAALKAPLQGLPELFFEDATAAASARVVDQDPERSWQGTLRRFATLLLTTGWPRDEQASMRSFYDFYYQGATPVPLLTYYEDYAREVMKPRLERLRGDKASGPQRQRPDAHTTSMRDYTMATAAARDNLRKLFVDKWVGANGCEAADITTNELVAALNQGGAVMERPQDRVSLGAFVQLVQPEGLPAQAIVQDGRLVVGFGKYYSRFLYLFEEKIRRRLVGDAFIEDDDDDTIYAEISGGAFFNGNLREKVLPYEILHPSTETSCSEGSVQCHDLEVWRHPVDQNSLILRHKATGRRVVPVDLGFLNIQRQPPLYQLLARFVPASTVSVPIPNEVSVAAPVPDGIVHRPRFTFDGALVLSRQVWMFSSSIVPAQRSGEGNAEFFERFHRWLVDSSLPLDCFVRIRPMPKVDKGEATTPKEEAEAPGRGDDYEARRQAAAWAERWKPQYIDFVNPLFVRLFCRMIASAGISVLHVEERWPRCEESAECAEGHLATELVVHLTIPGSPLPVRTTLG